MAKDGCTQAEIADHFGCAQSTISERFRSDFELGKGASKTSLRKMQFDRARAGSDTMLIHLGKVYLDQTDKVDITTKGEAVAATVVQLPIKELHADHSVESGSSDVSAGEHS